MGQTIAIVVAFNNPRIFQDVDAFDQQFGLSGAAASFLHVYDQRGNPINPSTTSVPGVDTNGFWEREEALDVEWAHAIAPGAIIDVVEADSASVSDLIKSAVATAVHLANVSVVSMSFTFEEGRVGDLSSNDQTIFVTPPGHTPETFIAATGDAGATYNTNKGAGGPAYPSTSPNVLAVGGTRLDLDSQGNVLGETGWGKGPQTSTLGGSGGGISQYEKQPSSQLGLMIHNSTSTISNPNGKRAIPDVAFDGDSATGVAVYDSYNAPSIGGHPWIVLGGTSLGTPCWAGLIAIVNQGRMEASGGGKPLDGRSQTLPALYSLLHFPRSWHGQNGCRYD